MKITVDWEADALYIRFRDGKFHKNKKIDDYTVIDLDKEGNLLGIELLSIKERIPQESLAEISIATSSLQKVHA